MRQQLNELVEYEVKGSILRSLSQNYEEGEKCTKYFFSLEKHRGRQKTICKLKLENGDKITSQESILKECRKFYKQLYESDASVSPESLNLFVSKCKIPQLNNLDTYNCEKKTLPCRNYIRLYYPLRKTEALGLTD